MLEWTHRYAEDGLAGLNPEDHTLVWLYASNVIQVTGPAERMAFLRRFTEAGVRVVAIYAWEPEGLMVEEIQQLGVHIAPWPMERGELLDLFGLCVDAPDHHSGGRLPEDHEAPAGEPGLRSDEGRLTLADRAEQQVL